MKITSLIYGNGANDATQQYSIDSGYFSGIIYVAPYLPPPPPLRLWRMEGEEEGYISPTRHPSICLAVGWLKRKRKRMKRREGVDIKRERGRITKRNEDRGREREGGKVGRKDGGGEEEDDWAEKDEGQKH